MKDRKNKRFKEIRDIIFDMQGFAGWAVEDYTYAKEGSETEQKWAERARLLIAALGSEEKTLQILNIIKR